MKNRLLLAVILLLPLGLFLFFWWNPAALKTQPPASRPPAQDLAVTRILALQNSNTVAIIQSNFAHVQSSSAPSAAITAPPAPPATTAAAPLQFTNFPPATVLQNMSRVIRQYGERFGGNPIGTNPEITRQLSGDNPKHLNFLSAEAGLRINDRGELVDPWDTPYFFHQISGHEMEIHSAGPDRILWTGDDLVTK